MGSYFVLVITATLYISTQIPTVQEHLYLVRMLSIQKTELESTLTTINYDMRFSLLLKYSATFLTPGIHWDLAFLDSTLSVRGPSPCSVSVFYKYIPSLNMLGIHKSQDPIRHL